MKLKLSLLTAFVVAVLALVQVGYAQDEGELNLSLSRDFGYASGTGSIQGTFSMRASGPGDLSRVVFLIDGQPIGEDSEAPFRIQFHTGSFSLGEHSISATGYTSGGVELHSREYHRTFVSADEGMQSAGRMVIPLLVAVLALILLSYGLPTLLGRGKRAQLAAGSARNYGALGGTVCPKCGRPFAIHFFKLNLVVGALDRCPYCGRWSLVRRYSLEALRAAEAAELESTGEEAAPAISEEERLRKELDDSRYRDL